MEFHWVALITLWTMFVGPVFGQPAKARPRPAAAHVAAPLGPSAATGFGSAPGTERSKEKRRSALPAAIARAAPSSRTR